MDQTTARRVGTHTYGTERWLFDIAAVEGCIAAKPDDVPAGLWRDVARALRLVAAAGRVSGNRRLRLWTAATHVLRPVVPRLTAGRLGQTRRIGPVGRQPRPRLHAERLRGALASPGTVSAEQLADRVDALLSELETALRIERPPRMLRPV